MKRENRTVMQMKWFRLLAGLSAGLLLLAAGLLLARVFFFAGPYLPAQPIPVAKLLDIHCHTAGIGAGGSGCFISKQMETSWKLRHYLRAFGTSREELESKGDAYVIRSLSEQLRQSKYVGQAVVLALDGVVDENGELDRSRTEVYVPNEFVAREVAKTTNLLFGASVNPYRKDALERLVWAKANGAKLVKWIPSIMAIDPSDERLSSFYKKLIELRLPLLCHAGQERSFTHAKDALCDPERLRLPLRLGVTVIVAHIASTGENSGERDTDRLRRLFAEYPNLYSEISTLTQLNKIGYLREALTRPEFQGRLLYGTDFPLINTALVSPFYFPINLRREQMLQIAAIENPWDRDVELKRALGVPQDLFERSRQLLE